MSDYVQSPEEQDLRARIAQLEAMLKRTEEEHRCSWKSEVKMLNEQLDEMIKLHGEARAEVERLKIYVRHSGGCNKLLIHDRASGAARDYRDRVCDCGLGNLAPQDNEVGYE